VLFNLHLACLPGVVALMGCSLSSTATGSFSNHIFEKSVSCSTVIRRDGVLGRHR
jgi:hypothetical protein